MGDQQSPIPQRTSGSAALKKFQVVGLHIHQPKAATRSNRGVAARG